jgi:hypothetical protein
MIVTYILLYFIYSYLYSFTDMMKACPSCPSSEDHYIIKEVMLRRTKVFNLNNRVALFLMYNI